MSKLIICAGGKGERLKEKEIKALVLLDHRPILIHTILNLLPLGFDEIVVTCPKGYQKKYQNIIKEFVNSKQKITIIEGGKERQNSVYNALKLLKENNTKPDEPVLVHNAANVFVDSKQAHRLITIISEGTPAGLALECEDTIREVDDRGYSKQKLNREKLRRMQTPQGAEFKILWRSYQKAENDGFLATDDLELIERMGIKVKVLMTDPLNFKITYKRDLYLARQILNNKNILNK